MKKINVPFEIKDLGTKFLTSDIWFTLHNKKYKKVLRPQRYSKIFRGEKLRELEKDVRKYISSSTCVVLPSYYNEGLNRSLMEIFDLKKIKEFIIEIS